MDPTLPHALSPAKAARWSPRGERFIVGGFVAALLLLGAAGFANQRAVLRLQTDAVAAERTQELLARFARLLSALTDVETGVRGFAIAEDDAFLEPLRTGRVLAREELAALRALVAGDARQGAWLTALEPLVEERIRFAEGAVALQLAEGAASARADLAAGRGKAVHDRIRAKVGTAEAAELEALEVRRAATASSLRHARTIALAGTVLSAAVAVVAAVLVMLEFRRRREDLLALEVSARALAAARDQAQTADRLKSAFLATMSHELRTPLNSILGFSGVLLQGLAGPLSEEQARQLGMVQGSARHLLHLINDVLDLSRITAGQMRVSRARVVLQPLLRKVADTLRPLAESKHLRLELALPPPALALDSDARRVEQILLNLAGNAIKFTERGTVRIEADADSSGMVELRVRDTGPGIAAGDLTGLFQPFHQLAGGIERRHEGTGLGLAISQRLADLLGGEIRAVSELGTGSTFTLRLPESRSEA